MDMTLMHKTIERFSNAFKILIGVKIPKQPITKKCPRCGSKLERIIQVHHEELKRNPYFYKCRNEHFYKDDKHLRQIQREMQLWKEGKGVPPREW